MLLESTCLRRVKAIENAGGNMAHQSVTQMFLSQAQRHADRVFLRHKVDGIWTGVTWGEWAALVRRAALGLLELGVQKTEAVCILSENCAPWVTADLAIGATGGVTAAVYASNTPEETAYVVNHSEARVLFVQNSAQLDKVNAARDSMPRLEHVILFYAQGGEQCPGLILWDDLLERGAAAESARGAELDARIRAIVRDDVLTYIYTSGTTGPPKGVMLTHGNFLFICEAYETRDFVTTQDESLSILPLAHALERVVFYLSMSVAGTVNMAESIYKTAENLQEVRPTVLVCVPRVLEKVYERIQANVAEMSPLRRSIFHWALETGKEYARARYRRLRMGPGLLLRHAAAKILVIRKLQQRVGGRIRWLGSGGAPLAPEIAEFFTAMGMPVIQAWGMTETTAPATQIPVEEIRYDVVGRPLPGVDVAITDSGEIVVRGPNVFPGYFKNPEATADTLRNGWCHTGDMGSFDDEGFLHITGRIKELIITSGGKNIAPLNLEFLLTSIPLVNQAVVVGDARPFLTALVTLDSEAVQRFAAEKGVAPPPGQPLELHPDVIQHVGKHIEEKNLSLARYESIKKFRVVPGEFTQETGELTPTMKLKKRVIYDKYKGLIDEMYVK